MPRLLTGWLALCNQLTAHASLPMLLCAQVASLPTKQRLLQSLIAAWPRRTESQLGLTTPRTGLLQRACTTVDEWRAAAERSSRAGSAGDVLWHGIKVAFEEVGRRGAEPVARLCGLVAIIHAIAEGWTVEADYFHAPMRACCRKMGLATACGASGSACWPKS